MCGLAGFIGNGNFEIGTEMIRTIRYRGPDFQHVFYKDNICLSHARLSIIDLDIRSNQPFFSPDKNFAIIFNGEIYNYLEIKKELQKTNKYTFSTASDTEVLLYAFQEYGINCLQRIHGMFVFAIYNFESKELFMAKDRMGKKPFYYSLCTDKTFVFASELKAVLKHPSVKKELNLEAVNQYLTFDYVPTPNSINSNVFKLEPGHYIIVKNGEITEKNSYWKHNFKIDTKIDFNQAVEKLGYLLNNATKSRLMSDVPLGVFLSGGLDSSTIAYYAQKNSSKKIKTFSIGFEDKSYDESNYAKMVADHLGTDHYSKILTAQKTIELIDEIYPQTDEPFADASLIPTFFLSEFTKEHVTVALGGDGSDELMAGYPTFISDYFKQPLAALPSSFSKFLLSVSNTVLNASDKNISFDFKVKQYLRGFLSSKKHIHQLWLGSYTPDEKKLLFKKEIYNELIDKKGLSIIDTYFENTQNDWTEFNKILYYYYQTYLLEDILVKVDRASMYNSLETRSPFLDTNVVEFLNTLPKKYKLRGFQGKYILKKLMEDKLPDNIIYRSKKGFGIPLSNWIRNDLKNEINSVLLESDNYFNKEYIKLLLQQHYSKKFNHRKLIWNIFILKKFLQQNHLE